MNSRRRTYTFRSVISELGILVMAVLSRSERVQRSLRPHEFRRCALLPGRSAARRNLKQGSPSGRDRRDLTQSALRAEKRWGVAARWTARRAARTERDRRTDKREWPRRLSVYRAATLCSPRSLREIRLP